MKMSRILTTLPTFIVATLSLNPTVHAQDTGDSFQAQTTCPTAEPASFQPVLKLGHYGLNVEYAQSLLGIAADGCFGQQTYQAVRSYQTRKGLFTDGIIGRCTWKALRGETVPSSCKSQGTAPAASTTNSTSKPAACGRYKCVVIDQARNQVYMFAGNGSIQGSGGMIDNPSKLSEGTYYIGWKNRSVLAHNGDYILQNYMSFSGDIGFHRIPINTATGNRFHGEDLLGTNQRKSDGCIRLGEEFSGLLWNFAQVGTVVVVT